MRLLTVYETQLYFQVIVFMSREAGRKNLNSISSAVSSTLEEMAVQLLKKALDTFTKSCFHGLQRYFIDFYMWLHSTAVQFQVLSQRSNGFLSHIQQEIICNARSPFLKPYGVHVTVRDRFMKVIDAI